MLIKYTKDESPEQELKESPRTKSSDLDPKYISEQAPRSWFHSSDKSDKITFGFLGSLWYDNKLDHGRYISCGSYELFVNKIAHQMNEKLIVWLTV